MLTTHEANDYQPAPADPLVITGSGNWSSESRKEIDKNMVMTRGDKRVADIYLTEFIRLFNTTACAARRKRRKTGHRPVPEPPTPDNALT
jgi:hypothetical protein